MCLSVCVCVLPCVCVCVGSLGCVSLCVAAGAVGAPTSPSALPTLLPAWQPAIEYDGLRGPSPVSGGEAVFAAMSPGGRTSPNRNSPGRSLLTDDSKPTGV